MAISQNFLTGRMRKSAGGTRFSTWRGLNIVASKPMEVRQNVTPAVQLNRNKMSLIGKMVSKLNPYVALFYSLGISKTTPFADTVKFFRNRFKDSLSFDATLFTNASFGTGNTPSPSYHLDTVSMNDLNIIPSNISPLWGTEIVDSTIVVINDSASKIYVETLPVGIYDPISISLIGTDFVVGDKIIVCVKPVKTRPGTDLSGTVKFSDSLGYVSLIA